MTIVTGTCGQELVDKGGQIPADTRLKESVLAGSVETLKNTTTPMSWCGSLNTLDGWSSIKSSMIELFEGKYATGADYCAYLDTCAANPIINHGTPSSGAAVMDLFRIPSI